MNANESAELVADQLMRLARPGGVVLVDSHFFTPLIEVLRHRSDRLHVSVRSAHFEDPVNLLKQTLVTPQPAVACCPEAESGLLCECVKKAHMLFDQLGITVIETHAELIDDHAGDHDSHSQTPAAA